MTQTRRNERGEQVAGRREREGRRLCVREGEQNGSELSEAAYRGELLVSSVAPVVLAHLCEQAKDSRPE